MYYKVVHSHRLMRLSALQDGLIINIGSIAGLESMISTPVYAASKWGLRGWSLSCYEVCVHLELTDSA